MQLHPTSGSNKVVCMYYEVGVHIHIYVQCSLNNLNNQFTIFTYVLVVFTYVSTSRGARGVVKNNFYHLTNY